MAERKFKFVSPGIFINEIDNSQLPNDLPDVGPIIIGRASQGPAMRPVRCNSPSEFVEFFGNPIPGGQGGDVWRNGNFVAPTYGAYAALGYLRAGVGPVNFVRLLGAQHVSAEGDGVAGWDTVTNTAPAATAAGSGGAYGLFLMASASNMGVALNDAAEQTNLGNARLAAVWYTNGAVVDLSGSLVTRDGADAPGVGQLALLKAVGAGPTFRARINDGTSTYLTTFSFDRNSSDYIRKVFNTNPQLLGAGTTSINRHTSDAQNLANKYWLGETFERFGTDHIDSTAGNYGIIVPLYNGSATVASDKSYASKRRGFADPQTGWVFSQDTSTAFAGYDSTTTRVQKLFKFVSLNHGEWASRNLKISITDIKPPTNSFDEYGTFTVQLRTAADSDNVPTIVEQYTGCNLNPASENYVAKKIGNKYVQWDDSENRLREYGEFENLSKYFYIEMNEDVGNGLTDAALLPFGFYGPVKPRDFQIFSGSNSTYPTTNTIGLARSNAIQTYATGGAAVLATAAGDSLVSSEDFMSGTGQFSASFLFPKIPLRASASDGGLSNPRNAYFGIQTNLSADSKRFDPGYIDYLRPAPGTSDIFATSTTSGSVGIAMEHSFMFSLDDISGSQGVHVSGSRKDGTSLTAVSSSHTGTLDAGFDRFTMHFWGGFDGVNIVEQEPFNNGEIGSTANERTSYAYHSVKRALDTVADPEYVETNIISVPGVTQPIITDAVIAVAEERGDCLAVVDIEDVYTPKTETTNTYKDRVGRVKNAVNTLRQRRLNSSYACTYYPWVRIRDDISNASLWVPPSVIAIGTFASSEAKAELWFAPAGFTRGGLSAGAGGWGVLSTTERLRREDRDDLYEANINPIATFPSEGIVIFGQKTLQVTPSALDRINVRRLLIFLKKRISRIAAGVLFDQNVRTTWSRFKGEADKFLGSVQSRLGLTEFRVVLDETTTTPDLIDRNILYAKIFLKPARAIEFIAIDFIITRTGASFDD